MPMGLRRPTAMTARRLKYTPHRKVDVMFKLACFSLLVSGCAASGATQDHITTVSMTDPANARRAAPMPIDPKLPSVDRIAERVRLELGSEATTDVKLCIRPSGKVASVLLVGGSALPAFDLAVVDDAADWRFPALPGPDTLESCENAKVVYRSYR